MGEMQASSIDIGGDTHLSMKHEDILQVLVIDVQQGEMGTYQA